MKSSDWKQLYQAVDELYPLFKDRLLKELSFSPNSGVTIWRWVNKYYWILTPDEETESIKEQI